MLAWAEGLPSGPGPGLNARPWLGLPLAVAAALAMPLRAHCAPGRARAVPPWPMCDRHMTNTVIGRPKDAMLHMPPLSSRRHTVISRAPTTSPGACWSTCMVDISCPEASYYGRLRYNCRHALLGSCDGTLAWQGKDLARSCAAHRASLPVCPLRPTVRSAASASRPSALPSAPAVRSPVLGLEVVLWITKQIVHL